jgi:elongation factor 1-beta
LFGGASSSAPAAKAAEPAAEEDDDDVDLFGSDDEEDDAENERIKAERVAEYQKKKAEKSANKPGPVAKSVVTLQVKPWDDETDMEALEKSVRSIEKDGLGEFFGTGILVPAY